MSGADSPLHLDFYLVLGMLLVVPVGLAIVVLRRVVLGLVRGPRARVRLAAWGDANGVAIHAARRVGFWRHPHPLVGGAYELVFRVKATDAAAVVRSGWAFVPGTDSTDAVHVRWDDSGVGG